MTKDNQRKELAKRFHENGMDKEKAKILADQVNLYELNKILKEV